MNFSEALTKASSERHRVRRRLWATDEWLRSDSWNPATTLFYLMTVDARQFGVPGALPVAGVGSAVVGPIVIVRIYGGILPQVSVKNFEPTYEDLLATDWEFVSDDSVAEKLAAIHERNQAGSSGS